MGTSVGIDLSNDVLAMKEKQADKERKELREQKREEKEELAKRGSSVRTEMVDSIQSGVELLKL